MGLGVLLRRCATGAAWIGCPRTLLTSCCVRAWHEDRSRDCVRATQLSMALSWPKARDLRNDVRLVRVRSRSEERVCRDHAI